MRGAYPFDHKLGGTHISGAEMILPKDKIKENVVSLIDRAFNHVKGESEFINISIQKIHNKEDILYIPPLNIKTLSLKEHKNIHFKILKNLGFSKDDGEKAFNMLLNQKGTRGALIVSFPDMKEFKENITRCVNMDYSLSIKDDLNKLLSKHNLLNSYVKEALCLSSKVCNHPNVLCEICISDDNNYLTGYIGSKTLGYIRIPYLKPEGHNGGGRIIFIKDKNKLDETISYLKNQVVLINSLPDIS